jgi:hypothetical protein
MRGSWKTLFVAFTLLMMAACGKEESKPAETATTSIFPALSSSRNNTNANSGAFANLSSVVIIPTDPPPTDTGTTNPPPADDGTTNPPTDDGTVDPPVVIDAPLHSISVSLVNDSEAEISFTFALVNGFIQELSKLVIQDGNAVGVPAVLKASDVARVIWSGDIAGWDTSATAPYQTPLALPTTKIKGPLHDIGIVRLVANDGNIYTINARNTSFIGTGLYMDSRILIGY